MKLTRFNMSMELTRFKVGEQYQEYEHSEKYTDNQGYPYKIESIKNIFKLCYFTELKKE